jgi:hypothetical protein
LFCAEEQLSIAGLVLAGTFPQVIERDFIAILAPGVGQYGILSGNIVVNQVLRQAEPASCAGFQKTHTSNLTLSGLQRQGV